jgi:hypothetical protein
MGLSKIFSDRLSFVTKTGIAITSSKATRSKESAVKYCLSSNSHSVGTCGLLLTSQSPCTRSLLSFLYWISGKSHGGIRNFSLSNRLLGIRDYLWWTASRREQYGALVSLLRIQRQFERFVALVIVGSLMGYGGFTLDAGYKWIKRRTAKAPES